ncbi:hypothetical protein KSP40_PGU006946 [Platanthera guangdongensis]|uniref:Uncharacterized protein n=1 Tax=Platanthera guangdongensis TaxID=2320717 RepID=A0ABR2N4G0_9ASPA
MELFKRMLPALLLSLLLASGMGWEMRVAAVLPVGIPSIGEEKGICRWASYNLKGPCGDCGHVCWTRGFPRAHCRGFPRPPHLLLHQALLINRSSISCTSKPVWIHRSELVFCVGREKSK